MIQGAKGHKVGACTHFCDFGAPIYLIIFETLKEKQMIDVKKLAYPYPYIPAERRSAILPEHNICSIAPADEPDDDEPDYPDYPEAFD